MAASRKPHSRNERLVLEILKREARPLSAYQIMEKLKPEGISSPMTVYRALARLIHRSSVHRIESLSAYIVIVDPQPETVSFFAVCRYCGDTEQVHDKAVSTHLRSWVRLHDFEVEQVSFELKGRCSACAKRAGGTLECAI